MLRVSGPGCLWWPAPVSRMIYRSLTCCYSSHSMQGLGQSHRQSSRFFYVNGLIIKSWLFRDTLDTEGWQLGPSDMLPLCWINVLWNVPRETLSLIEIMECNNIGTVMIYQMCVLIIISFRLRILLNSQILKTNSKRKHPETDAFCPVSTCWQPMVSGPRIMSNRHMGIIPCQTYSGSMIC